MIIELNELTFLKSKINVILWSFELILHINHNIPHERCINFTKYPKLLPPSLSTWPEILIKHFGQKSSNRRKYSKTFTVTLSTTHTSHTHYNTLLLTTHYTHKKWSHRSATLFFSLLLY